MKIIMDTNQPRRRRLFGPATIMALILIAGIVITQKFANRPQKPVDNGTGRIVFEADSHGHMRRTETPTVSRTSPPILWKPEPELLLHNSEKLHISTEQQTKIGSINDQWLKAKGELEVRIGSSQISASERVKSVDVGKNVTPSQIKSNLQDYSLLSRQYDQLRDYYWTKSFALLTVAQQTQVDNMKATFGRPHKP